MSTPNYGRYGLPGGIPLDMPRSIFRFGETTITERFSLRPQKTNPIMIRSANLVSPWQSTFDTYAVSWEIYAKNDEDLVEMLWSAALDWDFTQARLRIAPLSFFGGSVKELIDDAVNRPALGPSSELERLGNVAKEEDFTAALNNFRLGSGRFYRGQMVYRTYPVALPFDVKWALILHSCGEPVTLQDEVRIKINISGACKTQIEIG